GGWHQHEVGWVAWDKCRPAVAQSGDELRVLVDVCCDCREQSGVEHIAVAERKEPVAHIVGAEADLDAGREQFAHQCYAAPARGGVASLRSCKKRLVSGSAITVMPAFARASISAPAALLSSVARAQR